MRLNIGSISSNVGKVETHEIIRVIEQDAGRNFETGKPGLVNSGTFNPATGRKNVPFSHRSLHSIESQLAIVVPCKDEDTSILIGVILGIPHDCLIIIVSNSRPSNFEAECQLLAEHCEDAQRPGIAVHQQNEDLAQAFMSAGISELVEKHSPKGKRKSCHRVRNGKGEGMIIGTAVAKLAGKEFVGYIDADNLVTGAVREYCKVYAAGLFYALHCSKNGGTETENSTQPMVRIKWNSKPKVKNNQLVFEKSGRSSRVVNEWMNKLHDHVVGNHTPTQMIQTANAGEHAMSIDLAMKFRFATGYAVEPFQLIDAWERFGTNKSIDEHDINSIANRFKLHELNRGSPDFETVSGKSTPSSFSPSSSGVSSYFSPTPTSQKIRILQIETCSPHFHDTSKGEGHIQKMQAEGLSTIYHSSLTPPKLKEELCLYMKENLADVVGRDGVPNKARVYPAMETMDFAAFQDAIKASAGTLKIFGDLEGNVLA